MGIVAILSAAYALTTAKEILLMARDGQIYLITTLVTAVTALAIYKHGGFGPAHALAEMTLAALAVGLPAAMFGRLGST